jgi:hypothetical protein
LVDASDASRERIIVVVRIHSALRFVCRARKRAREYTVR